VEETGTPTEPPPPQPTPPDHGPPAWQRPRAIVAGALVLLLVGYLVFGGGGLDESDLDLFPRESTVLVVIDVASVLDSDLLDTIRDVFREEYDEFVEKMREETGFVPEDVDTVVFGGNFLAGDPLVLVVFDDSLDDGQIEKLAKSLRVREPQEREVRDHRVWGSANDRMAIAEIRSDTLLFGEGKAIEAALRARDEGDENELGEMLVDEVGLDADLVAIIDLPSLIAAAGSLGRDLRAVMPVISRHVGPLVMRTDYDGGPRGTVKLLDADGDVAARYDVEVDGDFLEDILTDLGRLAARREPARVRPARAERAGR